MAFDFSTYGPYTVQITMSGAQLDAFFTTPFPLLAAPGANRFIHVHRVTSVFIQTGANFYGEDSGVALDWNNTNIPDPPDVAGVNPNSTTVGLPILTEWDAWDKHGIFASTDIITGANQPLKVQADFDWNTVGQIVTSHLSNAGTAYSPGDTGNLAGNTNLVYTVDTVTGGPPGPIATYHIDQSPGLLPTAGASLSLADSGSGDAVLHVDTIQPGTLGKFILTIVYFIFPTA